jgi:Fur family zinc uptake transcriptional regulator
MHQHSLDGLTKTQSLVMSTLQDSEGPLTAYTILDNLRDDGFRAPLQVYRALEKLIEIGVVHRLESLNAFVACQHPNCDMHTTIAFTICNNCGNVAELSDDTLSDELKNIAQRQHFTLQKSAIELRGICGNCQ